MRLTRVLCFLIILGSSAVAAYAQTPVDPIARINFGPDPPCDFGVTVFCIVPTLLDSGSPGPPAVPPTYSGFLSVPYSPTLDIVFSFDDGALPRDILSGAQLTFFSLQYTGVPVGTTLSCESDIWNTCGSVTGQPAGVALITYTGGGPCLDGGSVLLACPGYLTYQEGATVANLPLPGISAVPEPSSMVLFGTGVILLFVGTKRRIRVRT